MDDLSPPSDADAGAPHDPTDAKSPPLVLPTRLAGHTPLALVPGLDAALAQRLLSHMGAATVADVERLNWNDARLAGHTAGAAHLRACLAPYAARHAGRTLIQGDYPDWFHQVAIDKLGLTPRMAEVLAPCLTLGGLLPQAIEVAVKSKGLSENSVVKMRAMVHAKFEQMERRRAHTLTRSAVNQNCNSAAARERRLAEARSFRGRYVAGEPFSEHISANLDLVPDRERMVLAGRLGIGSPPETLEQIAGRLGVTRERVRQVQNKALRRIDDVTDGMKVLGGEMGRIRTACPLPFRDVCSLGWAKDMSPIAVESLLFLHDLNVIDLDGHGTFVAPFPKTWWAKASRGIQKALAGASADDTRSAITLGFTACLNCEESWRPVARALADVVLPPGRDALAILAAQGRWDLVAASLLPKDGALVTRTAIRDRLAASGSDFDDFDVRCAFDARTMRTALRLGEETYVRMLEPDPEDPIGDAVIAVLAAGPPGKRWHASEIIPHLPAYLLFEAKPSASVDLERRLHATGRLKRHTPFVWSLPQDDAAIASIDLRVMGILRDNGAPMRSSDLLARLNASLPASGKLAQIRPGSHFVMLGHELWGLPDRDVPLSADEREELARAVTAEVEAGNDGIDGVWQALRARGLAGALSGPVMLSGILRQANVAWTDHNGRMRTRAAPVALGSGTLRKAIVKVLAGHPEGVTRAQVSRLVSDMTGRIPSPSMVIRVTSEQGVLVGPELWTLDAESRGEMAAE